MTPNEGALKEERRRGYGLANLTLRIILIQEKGWIDNLMKAG
jgi:hypothetical protein